MTIEKKNETSHRRFIVEEHVSLISEPDAKYIGHVTPNSGTASDIKDAITYYLERAKISTTELVAIGVDGTVVNTGKRNGVIRLLECHYKRPMQWLVCLLHANELPLRHLFHYLDGKTTGPTTFQGTIGKQLHNCYKLPIVNFMPIQTNLPNLSGVSLSADQDYLYNIVNSASIGKCSVSLANKYPGENDFRTLYVQMYYLSFNA